MTRQSRRCNLDGRPLSARDQAYIDAVSAELRRLEDPPWWWDAAGRDEAAWRALTPPEQVVLHRATGASRAIAAAGWAGAL